VTASFDSSADWPSAGFVPEAGVEDASLRERALARVRAAFPLAPELYPVREWLDRAPASRMVDGLARCLVAADHWSARIFWRSQKARSRRYARYLANVCTRAGELVALAMARAAILAAVPERWIPEHAVATWLSASFADAGIVVQVTALDLIPPELGGASWVRRDCRDELERLRLVSAGSVVAVVLIQADGVLPAVVGPVDGEGRAFGDRLSPIGSRVVPDDLAGVALAKCAAPPVPWRYRLARWLRIDAWLWRRQRRRFRQGPDLRSRVRSS